MMVSHHLWIPCVFCSFHKKKNVISLWTPPKKKNIETFGRMSTPPDWRYKLLVQDPGFLLEVGRDTVWGMADRKAHGNSNKKTRWFSTGDWWQLWSHDISWKLWLVGCFFFIAWVGCFRSLRNVTIIENHNFSNPFPWIVYISNTT